ncbi:hypothetical protein IGI04_015483 [Brassica rapa subsp. trilocularis]|uniref:Uncharacterized protein n=1 Tax=Brassica rapa subsp. trilocularis TaxID=1813537 RepID=A0ABQ7MQ60_BRACM|nr:hypothetical protein IGI04_015483 [Brassica rapa subsp. trilocularis]
MIFMTKYLNKSSTSLKLMERGESQIIFSDDEQVNPKNRASTVLAQQLAFKSDNKNFKVAVSE